MNESEAARIRAVYRHYDTSPAEQAKRDPRNAGNLAIQRETRNALARLLGSLPFSLSEANVLDAGCGAGAMLGWLVTLGCDPARCHGVDLLEDRIATAARRYPDMDFRWRDARDLPFGSASMDLVVCSTLFSSILQPSVASQVAAEIDRVLKPGGAVLWHDSRYPNPWNPRVRGYSRKDIQRLFPAWRIQARPTTVIPPAVRRLGGLAPAVYPLLARVPVLQVRYAALILKPGLSG
ncbi:MAG TPA: class I SAM-dependent methyltransferase [Chloroflexota bacterium]|nr:class I SAM-dependent methyltransferase [Chloroflexota bacterium]